MYRKWGTRRVTHRFECGSPTTCVVWGYSTWHLISSFLIFRQAVLLLPLKCSLRRLGAMLISPAAIECTKLMLKKQFP